MQIHTHIVKHNSQNNIILNDEIEKKKIELLKD
jgi:hypothetical protein